MTAEEILEGNKLLTDFLGIKPEKDTSDNFYWSDSPYYYCSGTYDEVMNGIATYSKFHTDWNWLMKVVDKIEKHNLYSPIYGYNFVIESNSCHITNINSNFCVSKTDRAIYKDEKNTDYYTRIEMVWLTCVNFVKYIQSLKQIQK